MKGYGLFFYPIPLTVDNLDDHVLAQHARKIKKEVVLDGKNQGVRIAVSDDGLLCIFGLDKEKALLLINTIFAVVTLNLNVTCFIAKKNDLFECSTFRQNAFKIDGYNGDNLRNYIQLKRTPMNESHEWKIYPRKRISLSAFEEIINSANTFYYDTDIHRDLLLLSEGFTLYHQDNLNASFLYGWMMLETFLGKIWEKYVKDTNRNKKAKENLLNYSNWTSNHLIEMFAALKLINSTTRDTLHHLRILRNQIVHKRKDVESIEVKECLSIALKILNNRLDDVNEPFKNM